MSNFVGSNFLLVAFVGTALFFDFLNGFHDSSNTVATMIASRAVTPVRALMMSAAAHFVSPFIFGVAVATTIGHEVVAESATTLPVVWAALLGASLWNLLTWLLGIPSSSSHALVGGLVGATFVGFGPQAVLVDGLSKILLVLLISPLLGLIGSYILMKVTRLLARGATPRIDNFFRKSQVVTALALALSHGSNDAQKTMGVITMGLVASGTLTEFHVPLWVVGACAGAISLGTALGGWRIIHTLGGKFYRIRPIHSFVSQISSAGIIMGAALMGGPVSTSHVVSTTILGAGAGERLNMVRWQVMNSILVAWALTIPAAAAMSGLIYWLLEGGLR